MRVLLLRNFVIDLDTLNKGVALVQKYASTIGLTLDFAFADTTKQFTSVSFSNAPNSEGYVSGVQVTPQEVFNEAKRLGYVFDIDSIACLVYDRTRINPPPTNPIDNGVCIQIPCQWYANYPDVFASFFLHELCHYDAQKNGVPDLTHKQYDPMWGNKFSQSSNVDYYLFLLKRYIPLTYPRVLLGRTSDDGTQTLGQLVYSNFKCFTLERPWKNNIPNISSIPKGLYECRYTFSWKFMKYTYEVLNIPSRSGIRIHSSNFYSQLLGCIALGDTIADINNDGKKDVLNSRATVLKFETLMNKQPFMLKII